MADDDSSQEKTEEPTPKRQQKAREEGQIARSKDLTTFLVMIAGTFGLALFGSEIARALSDISAYNFTIERANIFDVNWMLAALVHSFYEVFISLLAFFSVLVFAALVGPTLLGGFLFSSKSLQPKWNRLDPVAGIKRMFSVRSLVELAKGIAKVAVVMGVAYVLLLSMRESLLNLSSERAENAISHSLQLSLWAAIFLSLSTLLIALVDVPFQLWDNKKKLRMSRQDIRDELKDTEGKPEVKSKIRQLQMQMAQNRMMTDVPEADVVITNPTHFAVALQYRPESMPAPKVLAKGADLVALRIRELAKNHKVEFVESPALARAIFYTTDIGEEVPEGLYVAVAQVLAYVFQLREFRRGRGERPRYPNKLDLPPDFRQY